MSKPFWYVIKNATGSYLRDQDTGIPFKFNSALEAIQFRLNTDGCVVYGAREHENGSLGALPYPYENQTYDREIAGMKLLNLLRQAILKGNPLMEGAVEKAVSEGLLAKKDLVDGLYYYGHCRNARVARWDANGKPRVGVEDGPTGRFVHIRTKFGGSFPESINHPEDDNGFDFFIPVAEIQPLDEERVSDESLRSTP